MHTASIKQLSLSTGTIAYRQAGSGPPALLLHGWGGSSRYWEGAPPQLGAQHTLYALDLPGFGESPPLLGPVTVTRLAAQVVAFADALGLERFALVGHSFGAGVAVDVAARIPQRVSQLVLVSLGLPRSACERNLARVLHENLETLALLWRPWLALWRPWLALARPGAMLLWSMPPLATMLVSPYLHQLPSQLAIEVGVRDLITMDAATALDGSASIGDPSVLAALQTLSMPSLAVSGHDDSLIPLSSVEALAATMPNCRLVVLSNCGHMPMVEQAATFYQIVAKFLARA